MCVRVPRRQLQICNSVFGVQCVQARDEVQPQSWLLPYRTVAVVAVGGALLLHPVGALQLLAVDSQRGMAGSTVVNISIHYIFCWSCYCYDLISL